MAATSFRRTPPRRHQFAGADFSIRSLDTWQRNMVWLSPMIRELHEHGFDVQKAATAVAARGLHGSLEARSAGTRVLLLTMHPARSTGTKHGPRGLAHVPPS